MRDDELGLIASEFEAGRLHRLIGGDRDMSMSTFWLLGWGDTDIVVEVSAEPEIWRVESNEPNCALAEEIG